MFGLVESPFILEGTIDEHLSSYKEKYPAEVAEIRDDLYVEDLITGGKNFKQVASLKDITTEIFREAGFKLHKWHSKVQALEGKELVNEADETFPKQHLGVELNETKMLGLSWKKDKDFLAREISSEIKKLTKRTTLQKLASTYDHLGIISPTTIIGKIIYRDICDSQISWEKLCQIGSRKNWKNYQQK